MSNIKDYINLGKLFATYPTQTVFKAVRYKWPDFLKLKGQSPDKIAEKIFSVLGPKKSAKIVDLLGCKVQEHYDISACPKCKSMNITGEGIDPEGLYEKVHCSDCSHSWLDLYAFAGREKVKIEKQDAEELPF